MSPLENQPQTPTPPTLTRWYIDTRPLTASTPTLPLLTTLRPTDQSSIQKYYHLKDKHMSLASSLLKYLFIHRTCRVPWSEIIISRTPDPHRRPCYIPPPQSSSSETAGEGQSTRIEFNVSHQASMVALVGTVVPPVVVSGDDATGKREGKGKPEVGVDITCVNERRPGETRSVAALREYVDIFGEVFSASEMEDMKRSGGATAGGNTADDEAADLVEYGYRLFYTYWALKEAYIKMTGEALLAPWLRELEFSDVVAPGAEEGEGRFGEPYCGVKTSIYKQAVEDVRIEVVALEKDYLFATAARGDGVGAGSRGGGGEDSWMPFRRLDIERDIRPCAMGLCDCLS
ncbi:hypothetical protein BJX61DRAFT_85892 [Aspergillus egyptiacus]|nr:hypothetical protein BJX61DRAFT_85892 [Aspergillus egyptiacus]